MPGSTASRTAGLALGAALLAALPAPAPAQQQDPRPPAAAPLERAREASPSQPSAVRDALARLWARLRAATPRQHQSSAGVPTVTAGLRGSEATESELKPYWRGDRENAAERRVLDEAQGLADAGRFAESAGAFDAFLKDHPRSALRANAVFGGALARAALGEREPAVAAFEEFLRTQPQHPLARDAEQALQALR